MSSYLCALVLGAFNFHEAHAGGVPTAYLQEVVVTGTLVKLQGNPVSASQGVVSQEQLELRPIQRTGEVLEVVPGLVVTQHSGDGKANQYFLRGFNLDHGTDLATSVDGVPVNLPNHAHGQGYTDINFVIPELLQSVEYRKGTYYAETGNFSAAGAVNMRYRTKLDRSLATVEIGENNFQRALLALSPQLGGGDFLFGLEYATNDGPWLLREDYRKVNGIARYTIDTDGSNWSLTAQGYDGHWQATDQIPQRAVDAGVLDRFGYVDPTDGGVSHRYSLAGEWNTKQGETELRALLYAVEYKLDLYSNFTYAIDTVHGDQFEQFDDRRIYGGEFSLSMPFDALGATHSLNAGLQWRRDDIEKVGLYLTQARLRFDTVREDAVTQNSLALYASIDTKCNDVFRSVIGVRVDRFNFDVASDNPRNSGSADDSLISPKLSLVFGPWAKTELFANVGVGFHSNDARGAIITVDPTDGVTPVERVDPLVRALGYDLGVRTAALSNAQISVAFYHLDLDSELVYVGDAGATEPSGATERRGVEVGVVYNPLKWLIVDADAAFSHSRFDNGDHIPNAVERVVSMGIAIDHPSGWTGGVRLRYFSGAPLIEDNSVRSEPTTIVNVEAGYRFKSGWRANLGIYNIANSADNDITYFYESRLPGEPAPVADYHFHPVEPRTLRGSISYRF